MATPPVLASLISDLPENAGGTDLDGSELFELQKGTAVDSSQKLTLTLLAAKIGTLLSSLFASTAQGAKADSALQGIQAGTNITVDTTVSDTPIVNAVFPVGVLSGLNDQTGTTYTLSAADAGKEVRCTNSLAITVNIDTQANVPTPELMWSLLSQGGFGKVTIVALSGVQLRTPNGASTAAQYDARGIQRISGDEWRVW